MEMLLLSELQALFSHCSTPKLFLSLPHPRAELHAFQLLSLPPSLYPSTAALQPFELSPQVIVTPVRSQPSDCTQAFHLLLVFIPLVYKHGRGLPKPTTCLSFLHKALLQEALLSLLTVCYWFIYIHLI